MHATQRDGPLKQVLDEILTVPSSAKASPSQMASQVISVDLVSTVSEV